MSTLAIIGALVGAVFGLRCRVLVLVPAILLSLIGVSAASIAHGREAWSTLLSAMLIVTVLQLGYLGGVLVRSSIAGARGLRLRRIWSRASVWRPSATIFRL